MRAGGDANAVSVACPGGKTLLGGGCNTVGGDGLLSSWPVPDSWVCQGKPRAVPLHKEAEAICADRPNGWDVVTATKAANCVTVSCPAGKKLISGGCQGVGGDPIVLSMPQNDTWICSFKPRTNPLSKTATAICVAR